MYKTSLKSRALLRVVEHACLDCLGNNLKYYNKKKSSYK